MIDVFVVPGTGESCTSEGQEIKLGADGRRGNPGPAGTRADSAVVLQIPGSPPTGADMGGYSLQGSQTFTDAASIIVALAAPAANYVVSIYRGATFVGTATLLAGQTVGVVVLVGGTFTLTGPEILHAICPTEDASIDSPALTLG